MNPGVPRSGSTSFRHHLLSKQESGRGSVSVMKIGQKLVWASYVCTIVVLLQYLTQSADADPVLASSLGFCKPVRLEPNGTQSRTEDCCLPAPTRDPIRFQLPDVQFLRERKPAHVLANDLEYVRKYNLAYARMKALPDDDPRSFLRQWHIHCSFCREAFLQRRLNGSSTGPPLQVHYSWTFLPWHRMLIYFHEKILGQLIDDPTFTLPFWNWDNQLDKDAGHIPFLFIPGHYDDRGIDNSALSKDALRNPNHMPPKILPLGYDSKLEAEGQNLTEEEIKNDNLCLVWNMVVNKVSAKEYLGGEYVAGTNITEIPGSDAIVGEAGGSEILHDTAHEWVGTMDKERYPDYEDMGLFTYSGRDPVFYSHHANVDRLWDVWKTLPENSTPDGGRKRSDWDAFDFLESEFTFYDENQDMVIVKVKDTLDSAKLGYKYTEMTEADRLWIEHKPKTTSSFRTTAESYSPEDYPEVVPNANNTIGDSPVCFKLQRRPPCEDDLKGKQVTKLGQLSEGVVMERVKIPEMMYVRFDVFVDFPDASAVTDLDKSDYVGTFTHLPSGAMNITDAVTSVLEEDMYRILNIRFSTSMALKRLGITDFNTDITVTIVPRLRIGDSGKFITFANLKQEFV